MIVFTLCIKDSFAAAHRLEAYHGKCEELHGHNFQVEAFFSGTELNPEGMVIDFKILKDYLKQILNTLDHKYLNDIPFFSERTSSSEYIAMFLFHCLSELTQGTAVSVKEVKVWESDKAGVSYHEQ
ncbi:MAG: 6-carboxytetrahydropterin synthase QueD [Syntrophobacterales bacterium]|jgi:6-pyruvoyltetrahydropterin/6-carboxytetrahydropterin synthase|nr:6-carboxytetrahydropterin synthase QueD [Syntrophobacterales bacterium]